MSNEYLDIAMQKVITQEVNKVLEDIGSEIEFEMNNQEEKYKNNSIAGGLRMALNILNKYKAESEE